MFSTAKVNKRDITRCTSFWPILNSFEFFGFPLNKTPAPKPENNISHQRLERLF